MSSVSRRWRWRRLRVPRNLLTASALLLTVWCVRLSGAAAHSAAIAEISGHDLVQAVAMKTIRVMLDSANASIGAANVSLGLASESVDDLDPLAVGPLAPRVASYRNAYGSKFSCGPTCLFIAATYSTLVCSLLLLLWLIPLQQREQPANAAASRLWLGEKPRAMEDEEKPGGDQERGCWAKAVLWLARHALPRGTVVRDEDDVCEDFHEDYLRVTQALAVENQGKTYESIGVATDDLPYPIPLGGSDVYVVDDPERLFDSPPLGERGRSKRTSIFSSSPPPPPAPLPRRSQRPGRISIPSTQGGGDTARRSSIIGSAPSSPVLDITPDYIEQHRRMTLTGYQLAPSESKEDMVRAVERRASIQHRAERRRETAKSDISYENLGDEEIQMYEYLEFVRQLLEGIRLKKVCQRSTKVVKRTFFVDSDMTTVFWNKVGNKRWMTRKSSLQVSAIDKVLKGLDGNPGLASRGVPADKSALYVSILCTDGKRLDLEASDEAGRQRLFLGFSRLAMEKRLSSAAGPSPVVSSGSTGLVLPEPANLSPLRSPTVQRSPTHSSELDQVIEEEEEEEKDEERRPVAS